MSVSSLPTEYCRSRLAGAVPLVVGMRHFARTAGCRLIAEGIETREEARTLTELGVEFGQGYLFGRPRLAPGRRTAATR